MDLRINAAALRPKGAKKGYSKLPERWQKCRRQPLRMLPAEERALRCGSKLASASSERWCAHLRDASVERVDEIVHISLADI